MTSAPSGNNKQLLLGILAYFGPLSLIPAFLSKGDGFLRFHANQGLILFLVQALLFVLQLIPFAGPVLLGVGSIAVLVLNIMGIFAVCGNEEKALPVLNKLKFRLLK